MDIIAVVRKENVERFNKSMQIAHEKYKDDPEEVHAVMDNIMCDFLRELGFSEGVDIFKSVEKWYA